MKLIAAHLRIIRLHLRLIGLESQASQNALKEPVRIVNETARWSRIIDVWVVCWKDAKKSKLKWTKEVTTRTATQVCSRGVESGLGGDDAGVSGGQEGVDPVMKNKTSRDVETPHLQWWFGLWNGTCRRDVKQNAWVSLKITCWLKNVTSDIKNIMNSCYS